MHIIKDEWNRVWNILGSAPMAEWSKACLWLLTVSHHFPDLNPYGHVRKLSMNSGYAIVFVEYCGYLDQLQLACHDLF